MVAAGLALLNWLYGYFILPESLKPENRRRFEWTRANPVGTLIKLFDYPVIAGLFIALALVYISAHAVQSNWSYYTIEKFQWTEALIGISLGVVGVVSAIVQGGLIRIIIPKLGNERSVYFGLGLYAVGLVLYAFASQGWMMYAITVVYCFGGIAGPALQGIMSGVVPPNAQGELQGGFTSMMSITSIFGPLVMNGLFAYFTTSEAPFYFPGAAMLLGAVLTLTASLLARRTLKANKQPANS
jgi:DHA1 family tetracycline resistance protein-like MFS transporter